MFTVHMAVSNTGYKKDAIIGGTAQWYKESDFVRFCNMMDDMTRNSMHHTKAIEGDNGLTSIVCVHYAGAGQYRREVGRTCYVYAKRKQDLVLHLAKY